ncbi:hypothetical protein Rs2_48072 [Raphanus sativus]|nr:hypothetical protein Rs2_48072 [Raphanus sativus]
MKLCLLLNVIDPKIGGVMIMGDRGTGKSTTVRSLVDLLPEIELVAGKKERAERGEQVPVVATKINMVDLPLGATEDRVCGTIDIEKAGVAQKVSKQEKLQDQISNARSNLSSVQIDRELKVKISKVCSELNVDGLRGDMVTNRAAKALAALKGKDRSNCR